MLNLSLIHGPDLSQVCCRDINALLIGHTILSETYRKSLELYQNII